MMDPPLYSYMLSLCLSKPRFEHLKLHADMIMDGTTSISIFNFIAAEMVLIDIKHIIPDAARAIKKFIYSCWDRATRLVLYPRAADGLTSSCE